MGITLETNFSAIKAINNSHSINKDIESSIKRLSSGRKIQFAEDDASGMAVVSSLNNQSVSLREAIKNANDGIGVMQIADNGLGKQVDILSQLRTRALAAINASNSKTSVEALQKEIEKLMEEIDHIANTTTYNGLSLLSGSFVNKDFHTGSNSDTFSRFSIQSTKPEYLGIVRYETGVQITAASLTRLKFIDSSGKDWLLDNVVISTSANTGISNLVDMINSRSDDLGLKARASVMSTGSKIVGSGIVEDVKINDISLGNVDTRGSNGKDSLVKAINSLETQTGVRASLDIRGHLELVSIDGRGIHVSAAKNGDLLGLSNMNSPQGHHNYGRLTLTQLGEPRDIVISGVNYTSIGFNGTSESQASVNLSNVKKSFTIEQACAMGMYENQNVSTINRDKAFGSIKPGVLIANGASSIVDIVDIALKNLSNIRAEVAATQNKLQNTVQSAIELDRNLRTSQSQIEDTDYAEESSNLNTKKILLQANIYALSKSKSIRDLLLELLR